MADRVRILEGLEVAEDCAACGPDVSAHYPRSDTTPKERHMASRRIGQIIPTVPELTGLVKTSGISTISIMVHSRLTQEVLPRLIPDAGIWAEALFNAGSALLVGQLLRRFTKDKMLSSAWALGPLTIAGTNIAESLITPAQDSGKGLGANMPRIPHAAGVSLPYHADVAAAQFRARANRVAA